VLHNHVFQHNIYAFMILMWECVGEFRSCFEIPNNVERKAVFTHGQTKNIHFLTFLIMFLYFTIWTLQVLHARVEFKSICLNKFYMEFMTEIKTFFFILRKQNMAEKYKNRELNSRLRLNERCRNLKLHT